MSAQGSGEQMSAETAPMMEYRLVVRGAYLLQVAQALQDAGVKVVLVEVPGTGQWRCAECAQQLGGGFL